MPTEIEHLIDKETPSSYLTFGTTSFQRRVKSEVKLPINWRLSWLRHGYKLKEADNPRR